MLLIFLLKTFCISTNLDLLLVVKYSFYIFLILFLFILFYFFFISPVIFHWWVFFISSIEFTENCFKSITHLFFLWIDQKNVLHFQKKWKTVSSIYVLDIIPIIISACCHVFVKILYSPKIRRRKRKGQPLKRKNWAVVVWFQSNRWGASITGKCQRSITG